MVVGEGLRRRRIFFKPTFTFFPGGGPALPWAEALTRWSAGDWGLVRRRRRRGAAGGASNQPTTSNSDTSSTLTLLLVTLHLKCFISCQTERQDVKQSRSSWCRCLQVDTSSTSRLTLASTHRNDSGAWSFSDTPVGVTSTKQYSTNCSWSLPPPLYCQPKISQETAWQCSGTSLREDTKTICCPLSMISDNAIDNCWWQLLKAPIDVPLRKEPSGPGGDASYTWSHIIKPYSSGEKSKRCNQCDFRPGSPHASVQNILRCLHPQLALHINIRVVYFLDWLYFPSVTITFEREGMASSATSVQSWHYEWHSPNFPPIPLKHQPLQFKRLSLRKYLYRLVLATQIILDLHKEASTGSLSTQINLFWPCPAHFCASYQLGPISFQTCLKHVLF